MPDPPFKTEVGPLDGTPEKRMFWSIIADYDLRTGICELVDNAIDLWMGHQPRGSLLIDINLDTDRQLISIIDDAGRVKEEDLRLLIAPGGSRNDPNAEVIGIFGVGSKRAVVALAEQIVIKTRHRTGDSFQIDIPKEWLELPTWNLPAYKIPDIDPGKTVVELSHLRKSFAQSDIDDLRSHIGEVYEWFLQIEGCEIRVNGIATKPVKFDNWAFPPGFAPKSAQFELELEEHKKISVEITAGLIRDRVGEADNYGVYFYCNNRLIVKELKAREVGYFVSSEAGVPHPDASLCRAMVRLNGQAKLMPWNSSKSGINYSHPAFQQIRSTLVPLVSHFSSLSRRLKDDWDRKVFRYTEGKIEEIAPAEPSARGRLILPPLPRVNKPHVEQLKARNRKILRDKPWTLGIVEAMAAVDIVGRQRLETKNRIALLLLDSNFEIALKEFIVHRTDLFPSVNMTALFRNRDDVIDTVAAKINLPTTHLIKAKHYYGLRNKLVHERATMDITDHDVETYRETVQTILGLLFDLSF
jgi:Histidine kinase-, DNA gyrase B-, and HSP90-like ATPase